MLLDLPVSSRAETAEPCEDNRRAPRTRLRPRDAAAVDVVANEKNRVGTAIALISSSLSFSLWRRTEVRAVSSPFAADVYSTTTTSACPPDADQFFLKPSPRKVKYFITRNCLNWKDLERSIQQARNNDAPPLAVAPRRRPSPRYSTPSTPCPLRSHNISIASAYACEPWLRCWIFRSTFLGVQAPVSRPSSRKIGLPTTTLRVGSVPESCEGLKSSVVIGLDGNLSG
ncbi:hypothetical protein THAOC_31086 [Thalassiosira oceanica]|uniref:Uncharacterized protein n=1 Tax=Thalassiosira oceanica TaxID=159749 RepID=K0RTH0_THAOC|nr:hypothetical protein THAOC_31086 [Thalassiosira oceanica]|eukprot:EJK49987.1 hypothetical protein THAOC_31086 [Thalassiosira oceanica]